MASEIDALRSRVAALEALCVDVYQLAGTIGAPVRFLDALAAAAGGQRLPKGDLVPVLEAECERLEPTAARAVGPGWPPESVD